MSLEFDFPIFLSPEELDTLLAKGWFRMRENVFTTHYYIRDANLLSTVWLRSPLAEYRFSKSQRKQLRHLHERYSIVFKPLKLTQEHEDLYRRYLTVVEGDRSPSIESMLGGADCMVFNSKLLEVRDPQADDQLVALSVYDVGKTSVQSIVGVYDPDYSHESLGVYTMLLEVEQAMQEGFEWYYIGYFTPGFSTFDYKLRLKQLQYFNPDTQQWFPIEQLDHSLLWSSQHLQRLTELKAFLMTHGLESRVCLNVFYDTIILHNLEDVYLEQPLFLDMRVQQGIRIGHLACFCIEEQVYKLYLVDYEDRRTSTRHQPVEGGLPMHEYLIRKTHFLAKSTTPQALMEVIWGP